METNEMEVNGIKMSWKEAGEGFPVIFLFP
jgi:hypothetical protein